MSSVSPESARMELVECEREIQKIKGALRQISTGEEGQNLLEVIWVGIIADEGVATDTELALQLSAPMEEAVLVKIREGDESVEGSSAKFSGVECSMATLSVTLRKNGEVVGTSESYDLAPICSLGDALNPKDEYTTELAVAIIISENRADGTNTERDDKNDVTSIEEAKDSEEDGSGVAKVEIAGGQESEETSQSAALVKPACTLNLRIVFKPSAKDQKEELFELLSQASARRSQALERHKGEQQSALSKKETSPSSAKKSPAIKSGFLNKKPKKAPEENKWKQFYDKYMGPRSMARGLIFPIAKNYIIFFGAVILAHFKGQELALPAPV
jgi:hypothetical protein